MKDHSIEYKDGYKYQLTQEYSYPILIQTPMFKSDWITLSRSDNMFQQGMELKIHKGYAWDGPSGPAFDTLNFMRASLVHDAIYQLIREGGLPEWYRHEGDKHLYRICREDGMSWLRAKLVYIGVRIFGSSSAKREEK